MGFSSWVRSIIAPSPAQLVSGDPVVSSKPLHEQYQRIGGGITPAGVSDILRQADAGLPARLVDLTNESRQKDGHLQGALSTRDRSVALADLDFIEPEDATPKEQEASELCRRIRDDFRTWPDLVENQTSSYLYGHATDQLHWEMTNDRLILPVRSESIHARDFIFNADDGSLRYAQGRMDVTGIDLLADNPGRIVQIQRRIVGDVGAREGLARVLLWSALLRNWSLRDWVALGEVGWKPWRIGKHKHGAHQKETDKLVRALEQIGSQGVGVIPDNMDLEVHWPKNSSGNGASSTHRELFEALGREQSKAILGQTTSIEAGVNGDQRGSETRDQVRQDIRESDCRAVAAGLRYHMFAPAVAVNLGADVRCPAVAFATEDSEDRLRFSEAMKHLQEAGVRIPAKWVRDEIGMPEPIEGEEILEGSKAVQVPADLEPGKPAEEPDDEEEPDEAVKAMRVKAAASDEGPANGREYTDRVEASARKEAARAIMPTIAAVMAAVQGAKSYPEAIQAIRDSYRGMEPPRDLAKVLDAALTMSQAAGELSVIEEVPELQGGR